MNGLTIERQSALLGRVRRALRAWRLGRISGDTFDSIMARINARIDHPEREMR